MTKVLAALGAIVLFVFFAPVFGVLIGAFTGFVVGLFFEETILGFLTRAGFDAANFAMWQVGAALGFFGAFLRSSASVKSK